MEDNIVINPGDKFGKLTTVEFVFRGGAGNRRMWRCVCDCGNERFYPAHLLKKGRVKSCGCSMHPPIADIAGKRFGHIVALRPTERRDGNAVVWECVCDCGRTAFRSHGSLKKSGASTNCGCLKSQISRRSFEKAIHCVEGTYIEKLESKKPPSNNTSGIRGVHYRESRQKWVATIGFQGKQRYIGSYDTVEEAAAARAKAEEEIYHPFLEKYYSENNTDT